MNCILLKNIPFDLNEEVLIKKFNFDKTNINTIKNLIEHALKIANPKILFKPCKVSVKAPKSVILDDIEFESRLMNVNFINLNEVFPYIATCGVELENWAASFEDENSKLIANRINEEILHLSIEFLVKHIEKNYNCHHLSKMSPGSLKYWPLDEQKKLFKLLNPDAHSLGVTLDKNCFMFPTRSSSGIWFTSLDNYADCSFCDHFECKMRKAKYQPELLKKYNL